MEIEKAIEILRTMDIRNAEEAEAVSVGADALGKQIPAPLTMELYRSGGYKVICPCGKTVSCPDKYCCSCGQDLDWNEITAKVSGPYGATDF